MPEIHFLII